MKLKYYIRYISLYDAFIRCIPNIYYTYIIIHSNYVTDTYLYYTGLVEILYAGGRITCQINLIRVWGNSLINNSYIRKTTVSRADI